jgi:nucleotide-binding universal stress UspA family protein
MKNILVPIDFSTYSLSAAKTAAAIALKSGSNIHLLHIADIPVGWDKQSIAQQQKHPILEGRLVEAETKLDKFAQLPIFKNCNVGAIVQGGVPFEQITIFAKRNKITLIVMGVHGSGDSEMKFIGSTAQRVIRTAPCPVLGVKKNYNFGSLKKILFASDFDEDVSSPVNTIKNLAYDFGANIDFAYINTASHFVDDDTMQARMKRFVIVQKRVKFHTVIQNSNEKEDGILDCAKKRNASMIAMVTHLRREKSSYLVGVTESVLFRSKLPVLSFVIDESRYQLK